MNKNHPFALLGLKHPTNSFEEVRAAYRRRCLQTHPDRGGNAADFRAVREAWEKVDTPAKLNAVFNAFCGFEPVGTYGPSTPPPGYRRYRYNTETGEKTEMPPREPRTRPYTRTAVPTFTADTLPHGSLFMYALYHGDRCMMALWLTPAEETVMGPPWEKRPAWATEEHRLKTEPA